MFSWSLQTRIMIAINCFSLYITKDVLKVAGSYVRWTPRINQHSPYGSETIQLTLD